MNKEMSVSLGITEIASGWIAIVKPIEPFKLVSPGSTAYHEAIHAVAAILTGTGVVEASRVPGPGFRGRTKLTEFNAISFMAAHAMGCDGTGHDVAVVGWMGRDPDSAAVAARRLLANREDEIHAVASEIETKGTISGYEAELAMDGAVNPDAEVEITDPFGNIRHFVAKTRRSNGHIISIGIPEPEEDSIKPAA